ncbi:thioesterase [Caenimonas koreensis DSM 17982]|uniref:Thioesterase n=2 Tax=Caenimonas TaxID=763439 RepID=A0A844B2Q8_9BURK|nr:thioesterase [Caenimonas koreensis DSM 17982]
MDLELSVTPPVTRRFLAGWADMDWNSHMANTAYLNKAVDARVLALADKGFPTDEFLRLRLGVVVMKDEIEYKREIKWMEEFDINFSLAGLAPDGSRFKVRNEVFRATGELAACITTTGGFLDLDARKLVAPPPAVLAAYRSLPRTEDYGDLPSSVKARND